MVSPQQQIQQQHQPPSRSMADENHPIMEGIHELTLNNTVNELMVLSETIVDIKILKDNGFDFSKMLEFQG